MSIAHALIFLVGMCFACLVTFLIDAFTSPLVGDGSPYGPVQKWGRIE